jgi:hypothetical protein
MAPLQRMVFEAVSLAALAIHRATSAIVLMKQTQCVASLSVLISRSRFYALPKTFLRRCLPMKRNSFLRISLPQ